MPNIGLLRLVAEPTDEAFEELGRMTIAQALSTYNDCLEGQDLLHQALLLDADGDTSPEHVQRWLLLFHAYQRCKTNIGLYRMLFYANQHGDSITELWTSVRTELLGKDPTYGK